MKLLCVLTSLVSSVFWMYERLSQMWTHEHGWDSASFSALHVQRVKIVLCFPSIFLVRVQLSFSMLHYEMLSSHQVSFICNHEKKKLKGNNKKIASLISFFSSLAVRIIEINLNCVLLLLPSFARADLF